MREVSFSQGPHGYISNYKMWLFALGEGRRWGSVGAQEGQLPQQQVQKVLEKFPLSNFSAETRRLSGSWWWG